MLLHPIGVVVLLLPFGEILANLLVLLKQLHSLSIQLIRLAFYDDGDLLHFWVVELARVSFVWLFHSEQNENTLQGLTRHIEQPAPCCI